jgi:hypothetical protein
MPIDADIANLTQLALNVTPEVNSINTNQTTLYINGTLGWTPPFSTNSVPLRNGYVYLYYDANLDTLGYNALQHPDEAMLCVFGNVIGTGACQLANPVYNGLQYSYGPDDLQNHQIIGPIPDPWLKLVTPNIITYNPSFNAIGECSPPANSLLTPINQIYTLCNIYEGNQFGLRTRCPANPGTSYPEYCSEVYSNGTGICTSQMGLIGMYKTDSNGYFSTNVVACGIGAAQIIAEYYGAPTPEPISAVQSPLSHSADPSYPISETFQVDNYSWTPATNAQGTEIGSFSLGMGQISAIAAVAALGTALFVIAIIRLRTRNGTSIKRKKVERKSINIKKRYDNH